ncbi:PilZ domain-containing protein [Kiloniella sp. b19]|uniref:PilZ domain-containing protein n=1 Tax=Kiloniella sp. GXU_MW_B19 TaxID=3141326 RepID=UPI0031D132C7
MGKVVSIHNKERRKDMRRPVRISARLNGWPVEVVDISVTGAGVGEAVQDKASDDNPDILISEPVTDFGRFPVEIGDIMKLEILPENSETFDLQLEIVRKDDRRNNLGGRFVQINNPAYNKLEKMVIGRLR